MNAIEVKNLNKSFKLGKNDDVKVLKNLNFTIEKGRMNIIIRKEALS